MKHHVCILLCLVALSSCRMGYAVVLWSPDEATLGTGSLLPVQTASQIRKEYTLKTESETFPIEMWRVRFFKQLKEAEEFSVSYGPLSTLTAISQRLGLPLREEMDNLSPIIYRLAEGERVKILRQSDTKINLSGLEDYWYYVLTADGSEGWIFGYYLKVQHFGSTDIEGEGAPRIAEYITTRIWRPEYFQSMQEEGRIDLEAFHEDYGFFPHPEQGYFQLRLPKLQENFTYTELVARGTHIISALGSGLEMQLERLTDAGVEGSPEAAQLRLQFQLADRLHNLLVFFEEDFDIEEIRTEEIQRRQNLLEALLLKGTHYQSSSYGELLVENDASFVWTGHERLIPTIIQEGRGGNGSLHFEIFPASDVITEQEGVLTFLFSEPSQKIHFLYIFSDEGLRLTHIPPSNIENNMLNTLPSRPFVIFFHVIE